MKMVGSMDLKNHGSLHLDPVAAGGMGVVSLKSCFSFFPIQSSNRDRVLLERTWVLDDVVLTVRLWTLSFRPSLEAFSSAVI